METIDSKYMRGYGYGDGSGYGSGYGDGSGYGSDPMVICLARQL